MIEGKESKSPKEQEMWSPGPMDRVYEVVYLQKEKTYVATCHKYRHISFPADSEIDALIGIIKLVTRIEKNNFPLKDKDPI